jgi:hypothetical protein
MRAHESCRWLAGLALLSLLPLVGFGCGSALGPERFRTVKVSGRIVEGLDPVKGGWIEFIPVDGTTGNQRSARIQADGSFKADKVAVGENALRLVNAPVRLPGGAQLFGAFTTPIRRVISEHQTAPLVIDLIEEAVRYQAMQPRPTDRNPMQPGVAP